MTLLVDADVDMVLASNLLGSFFGYLGHAGAGLGLKIECRIKLGSAQLLLLQLPMPPGDRKKAPLL